jgi:hypothetical protein
MVDFALHEGLASKHIVSPVYCKGRTYYSLVSIKESFLSRFRLPLARLAFALQM